MEWLQIFENNQIFYYLTREIIISIDYLKSLMRNTYFKYLFLIHKNN